MGKKSHDEGAAFEEFFALNCNRSGFNWLKLQPGARIYGKDQSGRPKWKLVQCPFDYLVAGNLNGLAVAAYIDCKSINDDAFYSSMIDWDQINNLLTFESCGHPAGYVIYFRKIQKIVFVRSSKIQAIGNSRTIRPDDGVTLGDLYSFDLTLLWKSLP